MSENLEFKPTPDQTQYLVGVINNGFGKFFSDELNCFLEKIPSDVEYTSDEISEGFAHFVVNLALKVELEYPEFAKELKDNGIKSLYFYNFMLTTSIMPCLLIRKNKFLLACTIA